MELIFSFRLPGTYSSSRLAGLGNVAGLFLRRFMSQYKEVGSGSSLEALSKCEMQRISAATGCAIRMLNMSYFALYFAKGFVLR